MSNHYADRNISLMSTCPKCEEYFDLIEQDNDFLVDGGRGELCEHDTSRIKYVEVECPECGYQFRVDFCH